jgi:hypothetical protein
MRFKRIICMGGICIIFAMVSLFLVVGDVWGQCTPTGNPLKINYTSLLMSCGASQNLSASGGCPPYSWSLSGGGTLTPSGGGNTSATYVAPASNSNCANNAMITLTDCCRNTADIQLAVNCYTGAATALTLFDVTITSSCQIHPHIACWPYTWGFPTVVFWRNSYKCDSTILGTCSVDGYWCKDPPGCLPILCVTGHCGGRG